MIGDTRVENTVLNEKEVLLERKIAKKTANIISQLIIERNNRGLTQAELAKMCGLKQSAIARMENIQVIPRIDTIIRVATYLGIELIFQDEFAYSNIISLNDEDKNYCSDFIGANMIMNIGEINYACAN